MEGAQQETKKKKYEGSTDTVQTSDQMQPQPAIKAQALDAKKLEYHDETIAFQLKPGESIPDIPTNTIQSTASLLRQAPQTTALDIGGKLTAEEIRIKKSLGIVKHTDESPAQKKEKKIKKHKNKNRVEEKSKEKNQTVLTERQNLRPKDALISVSGPATFDKVNIKVNYKIYGEKNSSEKREVEEKSNTPKDITSALIDALKKKYQIDSVAFIQGFYEARKMPIEESFINLAIIRQQELKEGEKKFAEVKELRDERLRSFEDIHQPKHVVSLADIFAKGSDKEAPKQILIEGRAGIGKTTLCNFIANRWAAGDEAKLGNWIRQFPVVIWLPLRQLRDFSDIQNLSQWVHQTCLLERDQENIRVEQLKETLFHLEEKQAVLYLFDGYDEVADLYEEKQQDSQQLSARAKLLRSLLQKDSWLLTSRPHCGAIRACAPHRHLENIGFVDEDITKYVKQFFQDVNESEKRDSLLALIEKNANLKGIAHIPINLELICSLWKEEHQRAFSQTPLTMTWLYQELMRLLVRRYLETRCPEVDISKMLPEEYEIHPRCAKVLEFLEALAWQLMRQNELIFKPKTFSQLIQKYFPIPEDRAVMNEAIYKHFGLLKGTGDEKTAWAEQSYYFVHLTFQEYFAACYITKHLKQEIKFIRAHKYHPRYQIVWWLVAGLLGQSRVKAQIQTYFDVLLDEPKTLREIDQLSLVWRCWDEAGLPAIQQQQKLLQRLMAYVDNLPDYWEGKWQLLEVSLKYDSWTLDRVLLYCFEHSLSLQKHPEIKAKVVKKMLTHLKSLKNSITYSAYAVTKHPPPRRMAQIY